MFTAFSRILLIAAMLFAFVGQAFANTAMSCEMLVGAPQSHMHMDHSAMNHHEGMDHSAMMQSDAAGNEDCCSAECVCPANACSSISILNSAVISTDFLSLSETVSLQQANHINSVLSSLFRPPIFA